MAENPSPSTPTATTTASKKPAAAKRKPAAAKRKPAARRTTATTPSRTTGRRVRTQATNETREAAAAQARAARITAEQGKSLAQRAALTYIGATLETRDRVVGAVGTVADTFSTRKKTEKELTKLQGRYERRGVKA